MNIENTSFSVDELFALLYSFSQEERTKFCYLTNRWIWPDDLSSIKPNGWDSMTLDQKYTNPTYRALRTALKDMVSEWESSWYHWNKRGKTAKEHAKWWLNSRIIGS
jgi:hypothetical protein